MCGKWGVLLFAGPDPIPPVASLARTDRRAVRARHKGTPLHLQKRERWFKQSANCCSRLLKCDKSAHLGRERGCNAWECS